MISDDSKPPLDLVYVNTLIFVSHHTLCAGNWNVSSPEFTTSTGPDPLNVKVDTDEGTEMAPPFGLSGGHVMSCI